MMMIEDEGPDEDTVDDDGSDDEGVGKMTVMTAMVTMPVCGR